MLAFADTFVAGLFLLTFFVFATFRVTFFATRDVFLVDFRALLELEVDFFAEALPAFREDFLTGFRVDSLAEVRFDPRFFFAMS